MPDFTIFLVLVLSNWRIASMLADTEQSGPFDILHAIRYWVGVRYDETSEPYGTTVAAKAILCVWCSSTWIGIVQLGFLWSPLVVLFIPFALSAGTILVQNVITRLSVGS